jgi:protein gp37
MGKTTIEWTDASWNPVVGCTEISPGCANCYAARLAATRLRNTPQYKDLAQVLPRSHGNPNPTRTQWFGEVRFLPERLEEPLHWRKPRKIFVCDMGDLFHESVPDEVIDQIFAVMALAERHTFQVLTKRPERMKDYIARVLDSPGAVVQAMRRITNQWEALPAWPLPNVVCMTSVENQHFADERIPLLLATPAVVRGISAEPLLGPVFLESPIRQWQRDHQMENRVTSLDWVVCGGESGPNARPMHPDWARSLRDQCVAAGVPFFFKQWGEWIHVSQIEAAMSKAEIDALSMNTVCRDEKRGTPDLDGISFKVGKKRAGRLLDGRAWNEFPKPKLLTEDDIVNRAEANDGAD